MLRALTTALWSMSTPESPPATPPTIRALPYRQSAPRGIAPVADLWLPTASQRHGPRSVLLVHGGGFLIGSRRMKAVRFLATRLYAAGIPTVAPDYRLIFRGGRLDEATADITCALAWWRAQCPSHGLDPDAITVVGISAGGALALLTAAAPVGQRLASVALIFGLADLSGLGGAIAGPLPCLLTRSRHPSVWRARSPINRPLPPAPTLIVHGTADAIVPIAQAHALADRRHRLGLPTETLFLEDAPHAFLNWPCPEADQTACRLVDWIRRSRPRAS